MTSQEIAFRTECAYEQLIRYAGHPEPKVLAVLEELTEINDDLKNMRHPDLIRKSVDKIKVLLDEIVSEVQRPK